MLFVARKLRHQRIIVKGIKMTKTKKLSAAAAVKRVQELARQEGVEVPELLARAGVDRVTFWAWKNKKREPNPRTIMVIESVCKNI